MLGGVKVVSGLSAVPKLVSRLARHLRRVDRRNVGRWDGSYFFGACAFCLLDRRTANVDFALLASPVPATAAAVGVVGLGDKF